MYYPAKIFSKNPRLRLVYVAALVSLVLLLLLAAAGCVGEAPTPVVPPDTPPPAQPAWQHINTGVSFYGTSYGLVSGWKGTLLRTTDLGGTWYQTKVPISADLNSVAILDANTAIAVGAGGNILRSTDAGQTWSQVDSHTGETLNSVAAAGGGRAVAVGWRGTIIGTQDAGRTWTPLLASENTSLNFQEVSFSQGGLGVAVSSSGDAYKSSDGVNWQPVTLPSQDQKLYSVDVLDNDDVYLAGNVDQDKVFVYGGTAVLLKTDNGGKTWTYGPRDLNANPLAIKYLDRRNVLAAGWDGAILRTNDGGNSWTPMVSPTTEAIRAFAVADSNTVFAVGDGDTILRSRDGGLSWQKLRGS